MLAWVLNLGFSASDAGGINGALSVTLADVTLASTGTVALSGTASPTLANATLSAAGALALSGSLSQTLQDTSLSAASTLALTGALSTTLGDVALLADGSGGTTGALTVTLANATLSGQGELTGSAQGFSGGFLYEYEREQVRRQKKKREQNELLESSSILEDKIEREIAQLLRRQEVEDDRRAELERLRRLVKQHSDEQLQLSDRAKIAYVRALTQANFSAMEALDRELQRQLEEEEVAVLTLLLLNS